MNRRDKCLVLAQCDAHVTELLVQYEGLPVESMVEKVPAQQNSEILQTDSLYQSFDQLLRTNYEDAKKPTLRSSTPLLEAMVYFMSEESH